MNIELVFKNGIFLSLFLSMLSFWRENIFDDTSAQKTDFVDLKKPFRGVANKETKSTFEFGLFENISEKLLSFSFVFITSELIYRWLLAGHPPLSNLYESLLFLIWGILGFFLFVDKKEITFRNNSVSQERFSEIPFSTRNFIGCILSSTALFIQTFADWRLPSEMRDIKPLIPALQSNWLLMHVSIMILSYAALLIGSIIAITYIVISSQFKEKSFTFGISAEDESSFTFGISDEGKEGKEGSSILPKEDKNSFLNELDSLSYRILAFGFPLLTLGILSGAVWANEAWGSYWSWDPKETWAFITWLIFAFYLHTRLQYGWEGKKSALVATFGFFIVWICYLGVNLLGKGLHSYGWLS
jgi:cytochrome c-type biogenesis protein CcsB